MQHEPDTISLAEAAKRLGLNRSTLLRQLRKGVFPSHDGRVRLDEVKKGRAENLYPGRGDRWRGRRNADAAEFLAPAMPRSDIYETLAVLIGQSEATIAKAAIDAGASMRVAYATARIGTNSLMDLAGDILFPGPPDADQFFSIRGFVQPTNWQDLSRLAGETLNIEECESYCNTLAWFQDE